jgi:putative aldouronate transport system substrate-binding protein
MKKLILLLGLAGVFILSGCGKSNEAKVGTPENPYHIVWYNVGNTMKDTDMVMKKLSEYTRKKIGVTVEMKIITWADYNKKIQMIEASGESFDMCFTSSWANDYRLMSKKGYFLPLNDLLNKYAKKTLKEVNPIFFEATKLNGINYAVPVQKEAAYQQVFAFNKKYLDKYNLDISHVKKFEDLAPLLKVIKDKEPDIIPFSVWGNTSYLFGDMSFILDSRIPGAVKIEKGNHKVFNQFENKEFIHRIKVFREYYKKGYIPQDAPQVLDKPSLLQTGKWFCGVMEYQPYAELGWKRAWKYSVVTKPVFRPIIGNRSAAGAMLAISSTSERPDLVMKFINLLNTDKYVVNLATYGIEGIHYKKNDKDIIEFTPRFSDYEIANFTIGNLFNLYLFKEDPKDKWESFKKWNASAKVSPILGFTFDSNPVKTEMVQIRNIADEFCTPLFVGGVDPKKAVPEMLKKMKNAGLDKVMKEMQNQLDKWWAKNKEK